MKIEMEPCWKYTDNSIVDQAFHIKEEADEVIDAILNMDEYATDMEVMDTIQSCITYFAIKGYSQETVDELAQEMHRKNSSNGRDYYKRKE
jgi:phosphoribosyl-ATP pyrophosphohydrolase